MNWPALWSISFSQIFVEFRFRVGAVDGASSRPGPILLLPLLPRLRYSSNVCLPFADPTGTMTQMTPIASKKPHFSTVQAPSVKPMVREPSNFPIRANRPFAGDNFMYATKNSEAIKKSSPMYTLCRHTTSVYSWSLQVQAHAFKISSQQEVVLANPLAAETKSEPPAVLLAETVSSRLHSSRRPKSWTCASRFRGGVGGGRVNERHCCT